MARELKKSAQAKNAPAEKVDTSLETLAEKADDSSVVIVSERRAGKTIVGIGEKNVVFDKDGKATVSVKEAKYFLTIPDFALMDDNENAEKSDKTEIKDAETKEPSVE